MMFVVTTVSFFLVMLSSVGAMPISGTHATIGAFLGAGWIGTSFYDLGWSKLLNIVISWITAPLLSGIISYIIFIAVLRLTIDSKLYSIRFRLLIMHTIVAVAFLGIFNVM